MCMELASRHMFRHGLMELAKCTKRNMEAPCGLSAQMGQPCSIHPVTGSTLITIIGTTALTMIATKAATQQLSLQANFLTLLLRLFLKRLLPRKLSPL